MQNRDEKVNIGAFHDAVFRGEGLLTYKYVNNNRNLSSNIIYNFILSDADMLHTYVNMYIAPVMDDIRERKQV